MKMLQNSEQWETIAADFGEKWQFPYCLGALDGKHVVMKAPWNSGSLYLNYKGTFSTVLLALADANLKFVAIDIGAYGRNSDGGIFANSNLAKGLAGNTLKIPNDAPLPGAEQMGALPYVVVADEAFPLKRNIMRPFPGRGCSKPQQIYNCMLSRARRVIENAFGVLAARWRVYHTKVAVNPERVTAIVKATCVLHNLLQGQTTAARVTALLKEIQGAQTEGLQEVVGVENMGGTGAADIRNDFMNYFVNVSPVQWQNAHVTRGSFTE